MIPPWTRSTGDPCNRRYAGARCLPSVSQSVAVPSIPCRSEDDCDWRGRDGVIELADGRLVVAIRGTIACIREQALDWVVPREQLARSLNDGIEDPDDHLHPEYASAPTLLPSGILCVAIQGGVAAISTRGHLLGTARVDLVDDAGDSPNFDENGNALLTTIGGELVRWRAPSGALENVRSGLGYDLVCPAVLPDGRLVSSYDAAGLSLLTPRGQTIWGGVLEDADLVPTYSHGGLCLAGSLNEESSVAVTADGVEAWTFSEAAEFASHPSGILIAASNTALTALDGDGKTLWSFRLPSADSLQGDTMNKRRPLGHFVCEDSSVTCATTGSCFAIAPSGNLMWSLDFEEITSVPIPLSTGAIALVADGRLVIATSPT